MSFEKHDQYAARGRIKAQLHCTSQRPITLPPAPFDLPAVDVDETAPRSAPIKAASPDGARCWMRDAIRGGRSGYAKSEYDSGEVQEIVL